MQRVLPSPLMHGSPLTIDQWAELDEDDSRELVDGRLEEAEVPSVVHEVIVRWLLLQLAPYFTARGGQAFASGIKLVISPKRGRLADIVCFGHGVKLPREGVVRSAPELVVEGLSRRARDQKRDRIAKPDDYAALGARGYWLIDPWLRTVEMLELGADGRYARAFAGTGGTIAEVPALPGLTLDLDAMWGEIDALPADDE
jgi:Uma2 family endonuclease